MLRISLRSLCPLLLDGLPPQISLPNPGVIEACVSARFAAMAPD